MAEKAPAASARIGDLTKRLQREPASRVFLDLAREYHALGDREQAAKVCRDGLKKHPGYHSARVLLGRVLVELQRPAEAVPELEWVALQAPDNLLARRLLADALSGAGRSADALAALRALMALQPGDKEIRQRIEEIEKEASPAAGSEEASASSSAAVASAATVGAEAVAMPSEPERAQSEAGVDTLAAPPDQVLERAETTVTLRTPEASPTAAIEPPPRALPTPTLAELHVRQGDVQGAIGVYRDVLASDPSNAPAAARLRELAGPEPSFDPLPEPVMAEESAADALPTPTLAEIFVAQGDYAKAISVYRGVLAGDPENAEASARLRELEGRDAPGFDATPARRKVRALEDWLAKMRRAAHVSNRA